MRFEVMVQVTTSDGEPLWGYNHVEIFVPVSEEAQANLFDLASRTLERVEEAGEKIREQAGLDMDAGHEQS